MDIFPMGCDILVVENPYDFIYKLFLNQISQPAKAGKLRFVLTPGKVDDTGIIKIYTGWDEIMATAGTKPLNWNFNHLETVNVERIKRTL